MSDIRTNDLVLPEFQREYVWTREQAKQLLVSLTQKYPVGGLLFWKTQSPPELKNLSEQPSRLGLSTPHWLIPKSKILTGRKSVL